MNENRNEKVNNKTGHNYYLMTFRLVIMFFVSQSTSTSFLLLSISSWKRILCMQKNLLTTFCIH